MTKSKHDLENVTISILVDLWQKIAIFDLNFKIVTALVWWPRHWTRSTIGWHARKTPGLDQRQGQQHQEIRLYSCTQRRTENTAANKRVLVVGDGRAATRCRRSTWYEVVLRWTQGSLWPQGYGQHSSLLAGWHDPYYGLFGYSISLGWTLSWGS